MLAPKRVKFRNGRKANLRGLSLLRGATIAFGDSLKTVEHGKLTNQQIEAARIVTMRHIGRGGKVWIRTITAKPLPKPVRFRQAPRWAGAPSQTRRPSLYEIKGVSLELAKEALTRAAHKLPVKTVIVVREGL